jgi:uncharacterized membrane protein
MVLHAIIFVILGLVAAVIMTAVTLAAITIVIFVVAAIGNIFIRPARVPDSVSQPPR